MDNLKKTNDLINEFIEGTCIKSVKNLLWETIESLHYSSDFQEWSQGHKIALISTFRKIIHLVNELENLNQDN